MDFLAFTFFMLFILCYMVFYMARGFIRYILGYSDKLDINPGPL